MHSRRDFLKTVGAAGTASGRGVVVLATAIGTLLHGARVEY